MRNLMPVSKSSSFASIRRRFNLPRFFAALLCASLFSVAASGVAETIGSTQILALAPGISRSGISMVAGMLPMALALDPTDASKRSLGTVVIGGLTSSLILTLVLVPVMYVWLAPGPPKKISLERLAADAHAHAHEQPVETA